MIFLMIYNSHDMIYMLNHDVDAPRGTQKFQRVMNTSFSLGYPKGQSRVISKVIQGWELLNILSLTDKA